MSVYLHPYNQVSTYFIAMILCDICNYKSLSVKKYNIHRYLHCSWTGVKFKCTIEKCCMIFKSYTSFQQHLYRKHSKNAKQLQTVPSQTFHCTFADCNFKVSDENAINKHAYRHIKCNEAIICPLNKLCKKSILFRNIF